MPGLKIGGTSFIEPGVAKFTRGIYLFANSKVIPLTDVSVKGNSVIAAGTSAAVLYTFSDNGIEFEISNKGDSPMNFFMIFDRAVNSIVTEKGETLPAPVENAGLENVGFVSGGNTLRILPSTKLWSFEQRQVSQTDVPTGEKRSVQVKITSKTETPPAQSGTAIQSPGEYQVFQRTTMESGSIHIKAAVEGDWDAVEYNLSGKSPDGPLPGEWVPVDYDKASGRVDTKVEAPAGGWYRFGLRARKGKTIEPLGAVAHVGIGELFIGAGQSNSTSCGEFRTTQKSGMVSNFTGTDWRLAQDPQLGSADQGKKGCDGGSYYPAFGDAMFEKYGVPIGVSPTGHTGTSVRYWQPGGDLHKGLVKRMQELGKHGFRAVLWHQGETDADLKLTKDEYHRLLKIIIESTRKEAGWDAPWFVAHVSYPRLPEDNAIRSAQAALWEDGIALEGPDTDQLAGDNRDSTGVHFSPKGLKEHGQLWAEKVQAWIARADQ